MHTPGPYILSRIEGTPRPLVTIRTSDGVYLAEVDALDGRTAPQQMDNAALFASAPTLAAENARLRAALRNCRDYLAWYRRMAMEGQVTVTQYALDRRPVRLGDYAVQRDAEAALRAAGKEGAE